MVNMIKDLDEKCNCINCRLQRLETKLSTLIKKVENESALYDK